MEGSTRELRSRRWKGRFIRLGLVALAIAFIGLWIRPKISHDHGSARRGRGTTRSVGGVSGIQGAVPNASLGPGDLRIYNHDRTVNLVLRGNQILAGLSAETIARVQAEMARSSEKDSSGLGGLIASTVKQTVASTIGTHVIYPLSDIREIRYDNGRMTIERMNGNETQLFGNTKVNGAEQGKTFDEADAERFIEAVRARKRELGQH